jgi:RNA polymerase sigma-B factor
MARRVPVRAGVVRPTDIPSRNVAIAPQTDPPLGETACYLVVGTAHESADLGVRQQVSSASSESSGGQRDRLITAHLPLVRSVARRYLGRGESLEDLVQVGSIGLIKSSKRFDRSRGVAFATFATPAIEGEIRRYLAARGSSRRISAEQEPMSDDGTSDVSENEPLASSDERLLLAESVRSLDERERRIVFLRFHADMTERRIAETMGISQAHVSRLLGGALAKLRADLADVDDGERTRDIARNQQISRALTPTISAVGAPHGENESPTRGEPKQRGGSGHSGRFLVRMPGELHAQLSQAAERQHVSLNRYVTDVLAASVEVPAEPESGAEDAPVAVAPPPLEPSPVPATDRPPARALRVALMTNLAVVAIAGLVAVALLVIALQRGI